MSDIITITTQSGETVEANVPVIIFANRSTDIPAFYAQWFINRLKVGDVFDYGPSFYELGTQHPRSIKDKIDHPRFT